jgi:hypothetical protein
MHFSWDVFWEFLILVAPCVVTPILTCLWAKLGSSYVPKDDGDPWGLGTARDRLGLYGGMTLFFTSAAFGICLFLWLLGKYGIIYTEISLWEVFYAPLWMALTWGAPYLYLRRRLKRKEEKGL